MAPRTRIVAIELNASRDDVVGLILEHMYSRYPVYQGTIEEIVGVVHSKDLLRAEWWWETNLTLKRS